jgi:SAM-dependent methyltransferase/acyl carrier protein
MDSENSENALRTCIARYLGNYAADGDSHAIFDDLGLDSLQAVQLSHDLARQFHLNISPDMLMLSSLECVLQLANSASTMTLTGAISPGEENATSRKSPNACQNLLDLIADAAHTGAADLQPLHTLEQLRLDAFSVLHLCQDFHHKFPDAPRLRQVSMQATVQDIADGLGIGVFVSKNPATATEIHTGIKPSTNGFAPIAALECADVNFAFAANRRGYSGYWTNVAPLFDQLLLSYIVQGFQQLGLDLVQTPFDTVVSKIPHLSKYNRLFERLWDFLEKQDVVARTGGQVIRTTTHLKLQNLEQLSASLVAEHPCYEPETKLLEMVGPQFAACVSGAVDPVFIMFGSPDALHIVQQFYAASPMMATLTDQLLEFFKFVLNGTTADSGGPIRILEVGAGTGGTTSRLAEALASLDIVVQYTFTDVSPGFISQAKRRFNRFSWMDFAVLNIEQAVSDNFRLQYDIIVGANVVHATSDRTVTCQRLREILKPGGFIVLSEITRPTAWYDICFGLLDGWWLTDGGTGYPIQTAEAWMSTFNKAGFAAMGYSKGETLEANSQQLLVGCNSV